MRIRITIDDETGKRLAALRPVLRAKVTSIIVAAAAERINLEALLEARRDLVRLGVLINTSLRVSRATATDWDSVREAAAIIHSLTRNK